MRIFPAVFLLCLVFSTQAQNTSAEIIHHDELKEKPIFAGCEDNSDDNCSTLLFAQHIQENFNKEILSDSINEVIIDFRFILGPEGNVKWQSVKAASLKVKNEATRIIERLPAYRPGWKDGKKINVLMRHTIKVVNTEQRLTFNEVDTPPLNENCIDSKDQKVCFSSWISNYRNKNFNFKTIKKELESGTPYKSHVDFVIDKNGNFTDIKIVAPHKLIESELARLMQSLPKVKPAQVNNHSVAISFKLPVIFAFSN